MTPHKGRRCGGVDQVWLPKSIKDYALESVLENPVLTELLIERLMDDGVKFSSSPWELTHDDRVACVRAVMAELAKREAN